MYHSGQAPYMLHDIRSRHLEIPEHRVRVISKDVGGSSGLTIHAGVAAAPGAVLNAVNGALSPFGARVTRVPMTPEVILRALGKL